MTTRDVAEIRRMEKQIAELNATITRLTEQLEQAQHDHEQAENDRRKVVDALKGAIAEVSRLTAAYDKDA